MKIKKETKKSIFELVENKPLSTLSEKEDKRETKKGERNKKSSERESKKALREEDKKESKKARREEEKSESTKARREEAKSESKKARREEDKKESKKARRDEGKSENKKEVINESNKARREEEKSESKKALREEEKSESTKEVRKPENTTNIKSSIKKPKKEMRNKNVKGRNLSTEKNEISENRVKRNKQEKNNRQERDEQDNKKYEQEKNKRDNKSEKKLNDQQEKTNTQKKQEIGVKLTKLEEEILQKGTIKDKINILTLICQKNLTETNFKNLLFYVENQRNDVIFMTLKNLKDLILSKGIPTSNFIKQKITKCYDINLKNRFIKTKVLRLVYDLLKNNIFFLDLIYSFINKIGDKKDIEKYVRENLVSLFYINEEVVLHNIEDFIHKNENFKCHNSILKFLDFVVSKETKKLCEIYKTILEYSKNYKDEQKIILREKSLSQLSSVLNKVTTPKDLIDEDTIQILIDTQSTDTICYHSINILILIENENTKTFIIQVFKSLKFYKNKYSEKIYQIVKKITESEENQDFLCNILNCIILYPKDLIIAFLSLAIRKQVEYMNVFDILENHYSNIIRKMIRSIKNREFDIPEINSFDLLTLEAYEEIYK